MKSISPFHLIIPVFLLVSGGAAVQAQWVDNGVVVCDDPGQQSNPGIVTDGDYGAIIVWEDYRDYYEDFYCQRLDSTGVAQWDTNGVAMLQATYNNRDLVQVTDGAGGAIFAWRSNRGPSGYDIYVQRIDASGTVRWQADGVAIGAADYTQTSPAIVADGSGGVIVAWGDYRNGSHLDIYAQRVDADGTALWTGDGHAVCTAAEDQYRVELATDGAGGAILAWQDGRSGYNIYAQRITAGGTVAWTANGVVLCDTTGNQYMPLIVADGSGGAIVAWGDARNGGDLDLYAQRVNSGGATLWTDNGEPVCTGETEHTYYEICSGGSGSAIVAWPDDRDSAYHIYAQKLHAGGWPQWTTDGVAMMAVSSNYIQPQLVSDSAGGVIVAVSNPGAGDEDIYAQRLDASGTVVWTAGGVAVCDETSHQFYPAICTDGAGGAIIAWHDQRAGDDIYAQRVTQYGVTGGSTISDTPDVNVAVRLDQNRPNPFNPVTSIRFQVADPGNVRLRIFDLQGRLVRVLIDDNRSSGWHEVQWDGRSDQRRNLPSGAYMYQLESAHRIKSRVMTLVR